MSNVGLRLFIYSQNHDSRMHLTQPTEYSSPSLPIPNYFKYSQGSFATQPKEELERISK